MRLVRNLAPGTSDNITAFLLLHVMQLLLSGLVNCHNILLKDSQLVLKSIKLLSKLVFALLILVELLVQDHNLLLVVEFLAFVESLLQSDAITLVLQLAILVVIND